MRRLLLFALIVSPTALATDLAQPVTAMVYWQQPLDGGGRRESASAAFTHSRGAALHQNQPVSGEPAPEINWWLVLGISAAAVAVIHDENKKTPPAPPAPSKGGGS